MALPRVFISTDLLLSSEEKDGGQSLIHALMYQDKMNIVGISGTASKWNHQDGRVGDIDKVLDVYGEDLSNLREHSSAFKSVEALKAVSWQNYVGARDGFYQDVRTSAGQAYDLEFDLRTRPGIAISTQGVEVAWNGRVIETIRPGAAWDSADVGVTGTGGLDRLTIREVASQSGDGLGALLDNFQLTGAAITPPATSFDTVIVKASGDAYRGDPNFAVFVNGVVVDSTNVVTADNAEGEWEVFTFKGDFDLDGTDTVGIRFTNDRYSKGVGDRNLYVDEITLNGQVNDANLSMPRNAYEYWDF